MTTRVLLAGALVSLGLAAPAGAAPLTRPALPSSCREWGGEEVVALACDPARRASAVRLRLGAAVADQSERGIAHLLGREPLQVGETLTLTWSHPSSTAVLAVKVAAPQGMRDLVLDLRARPARVDVTAQAGGALQVTTPAGSATVPAPSRAARSDLAAAQRACRRNADPRRRGPHGALDLGVEDALRGAGPRRLLHLRAALRRPAALPMRERPGLRRLRRRECAPAHVDGPSRRRARAARRPGAAEHHADAPLRRPVAVRSEAARHPLALAARP